MNNNLITPNLLAEFKEIIEMLKSLKDFKSQCLPIVSIALNKLYLLYEYYPDKMSSLLSNNISEINIALKELENYATSIDNWKIAGYPLVLKEQCAILNFLITQGGSRFQSLSNNFKTREELQQLILNIRGLSI